MSLILVNGLRNLPNPYTIRKRFPPAWSGPEHRLRVASFFVSGGVSDPICHTLALH